MPRLYNCANCHQRHEAPTGPKCLFTQDGNISDGSSDSDPDISLNKTIISNEKATPVDVESRLDKLENMIFKLSENVMILSDSRSQPARYRSTSTSSTDSSDDRFSHHSSRSRSPSKLDNRFSYEHLFLDEDFRVKNYQDVMLALFKTFRLFLEEGRDISGLVDHGQYLSEKASADVYVAETFVNFDKFTRAVAHRKGPNMFGKISEMDKNRYFSIENYKDVRAFRGKMKVSAGPSKKKSAGICYQFNSESGCQSKACQYHHRCALCDFTGHSAKDCRVIRKKEINNK